MRRVAGDTHSRYKREYSHGKGEKCGLVTRVKERGAWVCGRQYVVASVSTLGLSPRRRGCCCCCRSNTIRNNPKQGRTAELTLSIF